MSNKIAWEKWDETDFFETELELEKEGHFEDDLESDVIPNISFGPIINPRVKTPIGVFSIDDPLRPSKMFDCWIGHTNFDITYEIAELLENVPGVEVFKVLSRYRFFIGVGKLFEFRTVRQNIQDFTGGESSTLTQEDDFHLIEILQEQLSSFKRWAVFYSNEGFIDYIATNEENDQEYDLKLTSFKKDKNYTVISSDDNENGVI